MDTHIKFIIKKKSSQTGPFKTIEGFIDKSNLEDVLFEFDEYDDVNIIFEYDKSNGEVYIDTFNNVNKILCNPNENIILNLGHKENSLVPGYFEIKVNNKNEDIYYFKVKPKNLEWSDLINLRQILNNYIKGLSVNFNLSKSSYNYKISNDILEYYNNQYNLWQEIKLAINLILNNPCSENEKIYGYYNNPNKIDKRTIRKNTDNISTKYYTYNRKMTYNTSDNIILYNSIQEYSDTLSKSSINIEDTYKNEFNKLKEINTLYTNRQNELNSIKNNYSISQKYKQSIQGKVNYLRKSKYMQQEKLQRINNLNSMLNEIISEIQEILFEIEEKLELSNINRKTTSSVKNLRYKNVIDMLNTIIETKEHELDLNNNEETLTFRFKKTELLFEYLCFIRTLETMLKLGYDCYDGWFENIINQGYNIEIPSECDNYFRKDNIEIVISYDKEAPNVLTEDYEGLYSFNSDHRRPDISILIYKDGVFIKALILEVKCRASRYIYTKQGDTEVIDTMKDYSQLCYHKDKITRNVIDKVITLYPKQENIIKFEENELIDIFSFVSIDVSLDKIDDELYMEIKEFIDKYVS